MVIEFADEINRAANDAVINLKNYLAERDDISVRECVPTYRSLAVYFDPAKTSAEEITDAAKRCPRRAGKKQTDAREIVVPVCYGGAYGCDLPDVAKHAGLTEEEVVEIHTSPLYHCYMNGFLPGFAYLGGMDERIATPRLSNPRLVIKGGSVGIAGAQTGIYPIDSPGGWRLIGRTPLKLFAPDAPRPTLIEAGFDVRFKAVCEEEYKEIEKELSGGEYVPAMTEAS